MRKPVLSPIVGFLVFGTMFIGCTSILGDFTQGDAGLDGGASLDGRASDTATGPDHACVSGASCTIARLAKCQVGVTECKDGLAVCVPGHAPDGTVCADGFCTDGVCAPCTTAKQCTPVGKTCQTGSVSCDKGYQCTNATPVTDGTLCSGGACCGGTCASCELPTHSSPACTGTSCTLACDTGYHACTTMSVSSCVDFQNDASNCGSCGHSCGTGGTCSGGLCEPFTVFLGSDASVASKVIALVSDGTNVYWVNSVNSQEANVYQAALTSSGGSGAIELSQAASDSQGPAVGVGVSGSKVAYALNLGGEDPSFLLAAEGMANSASDLYTIIYGGIPVSQTNDGSTFYVAINGYAYDGTNYSYGIMKTPLTSSTGTGGIGLESAYSTDGVIGNTMAAVSGLLFWTDTKYNAVYWYDGGDMDELTGTVAGDQTGAQNLTTDGKNLYWVAGPTASATIEKVFASASAGQPLTKIASVSDVPLAGIQTVASDGNNVYWADNGGGSGIGVYSAPTAGGGKPALRAAATGGAPSCLAIGGKYLIWFEPGATTGTIRAALLP
jgi:hypothetical protein